MSSVGIDEATGGEVEEWDYLNLFFRRFNKALLDKAAVDKEKVRWWEGGWEREVGGEGRCGLAGHAVVAAACYVAFHVVSSMPMIESIWGSG